MVNLTEEHKQYPLTIQRRYDNTVDFDRFWNDYKAGFGEIAGEHWIGSQESCQSLGGKLVELETQEENEFIKNAVMTIGSGVNAYWIGGYNFNNDSDVEWLSKPNQAMPITDWNMETYPQPD
ncbi:angiopoietin-2-like [Mytilus edulis]|uniref:angiopoietin-2-like n=1 Tax=Mytilus edulis TaxID=6550 RepID=UPI0039EF8D09